MCFWKERRPAKECGGSVLVLSFLSVVWRIFNAMSSNV